MSRLGRLLGGTEKRDIFDGFGRIPLPGSGTWNASGFPVNTDSALRHGALYACVSLIANALSTTPIDAYRKRGDRRETLPSPALLTNPDGDRLQVEWMFSLVTSLLLRGNAYGYKTDFDDFGYPRQVQLVHPDEVSISYQQGAVEYRFGGDVVPLERVFHLRGFTMPGWVEGLSVVQHHAQSIGVGLAAGRYGATFYDSGGHPSAVLQSDQWLTQDQAEVLKERVVAKLRQGNREPIVLGAGTTWNPIQIPPNESMFLDAQRYSAIDIARIFSVPPEKIGAAVEGGGSLTYGNREANVIEFQTDALLPWAVRIEQALTKLIPRGQFVKFNMDAAIRVDVKTRYEVHSIGLAGKQFLTVDEVRALEDREPDAELNQPPVPPAPPAPPEEEPDVDTE